jgi:2-hydroxychromene-2-carboxylate isomerase
VTRTLATFCFDLESPWAYFAAERALQLLPVAAEWQPVLGRDLPGAIAPSVLGEGQREAELELLCARARELGLQPFRLPEPYPFDGSLAMRVATYAKSIGRVVPFVQAAYRQAFAGGHSLEDPDFVLIAAAACEMHPRAVLSAADSRSVAAQLRDATATAARLGVTELPALVIGGSTPAVFEGEHALEEAAARLEAGGAADLRTSTGSSAA